MNVTTIDNHKHLWLTLDSILTFARHINEKIAIARKGIGIINYLYIFTPVETLDQIYKMFVRPRLDYCNVIYHVPSITNPFDSAVCLPSSIRQH